MRRAQLRKTAWVLTAGVVYVYALVGCELVAGVGSLGERGSDGGGQDSTTEDGSGSDSGSSSGSDSDSNSGSDSGSGSGGGSGSSSGADSGRDATTGDGGSEAGDASIDACAPNGTGQVGTLGCPCSPSGALACNGNAQKVTLICSGGVWTLNQTCPSGQLCDAASGISQGTCQPIDPACTSASPGQHVCGTTTTVVQCGPDLVSDSPVETCASQTCVSGACTGVCAPGQTNPVACGNCGTGTDTQTCGATGAWQTSGSCPGQGACAPGATQACNTYGTQTCGATCAWGSCSCALAAVCVPNATQCSGNGVQTCSACGQWGTAVACASSQSCSGGSCMAITSCATGGAGMTNCGTGSESCCTSLEVTGGTYSRTYMNNGGGPTGTADPATVSGFRLDKYAVTVGRFREFVTAWNGGSGWTPPAGSGKHTHLNGGQGLANSGSAGTYEPGWVTADNSNIAPTNANLACSAAYETWTNSAGSHENLPINCVDWSESAAFCIWDGGFLPSEAEWEYAAAGGGQERYFPWGSTLPGTACPGTGCEYAIYNCDYPSGSGTCSGVMNIAPVGTATLGAGVWGQLDLEGNVLQWTMDWYATYVNPCTDCGYSTAASARVYRGGGCYVGSSGLVPWSRSGTGSATYRSYLVGLRCARTP